MPRASFDQLTAFVAVAEHGSFSQAARVIGKDRATLHHQVSDLEIDWDVILFERKGRTPVLTEVGGDVSYSSQAHPLPNAVFRTFL